MPDYPLDQLWFRLLCGTLFGLVLGSFITMLSYRLPRGLSIISPPSHCPKCQMQLKLQDLVPVFSWLLSAGKCRQCKSPIGVRYLLIELVTMIGFLAAFGAIGFQPSLFLALIGIVALVTMATIILEKHKDSQN